MIETEEAKRARERTAASRSLKRYRADESYSRKVSSIAQYINIYLFLLFLNATEKKSHN